MHPLLIVLMALGGLLLLILLLLIFGHARIRIRCREKLRVTIRVCGIPYTLVSDSEPKEKDGRDLSRCYNPDAVLRRELRRQKRLARKAEKKRLRAEAKAARRAKKKKELAVKHAKKPTPNLKEKLDMILALLQKLYAQTQGKLTLKVKRMHLYVGTGDAAQTALLYAAILQSATFLLQWIQLHFMRIKRREGAMIIEPDYTSGKTHADIDIICSIRLIRAVKLGVAMLLAYRKEKSLADRRAKRRVALKELQDTKSAK